MTAANDSTGHKFEAFLDVVRRDDETTAAIALSANTSSADFILNQRDANGWNALIWAAFANSNGVLATLLSHSADVTSVCKRGNTALHWCSQANNAAGIKLLIGANAQIDSTNNLGCTPMHLAVASGRGSSVQELFHHGASLTVTNKFSKTPGDIVQERPSLQCNPQLDLGALQNGARPDRVRSDASLSSAKGTLATEYSQLGGDGVLMKITDDLARALRRESAAVMARQHARREDNDSPEPTEVTTMDEDGIENDSAMPSRVAELPVYNLASGPTTTSAAREQTLPMYDMASGPTATSAAREQTLPMYDMAAGSNTEATSYGVLDPHTETGVYEATEDIKQHTPVSITVTEESELNLPAWTPGNSDSETDATDAEDALDELQADDNVSDTNSWGFTGNVDGVSLSQEVHTGSVVHYAESRQVSQHQETVVYATTPANSPPVRQYESIEDVKQRAQAQRESVAYAAAASVNSTSNAPAENDTRSLYATAMSVIGKKSTHGDTKVIGDPTTPIVVSITKGDNGFGIKFGGPRSDAEAQQYGRGLYVAGCVPDSPADKAPELQLGMRIVAVNGHTTDDVTNIKQVRNMMTAEDTVLELTVVQDRTLWTKYRERSDLRRKAAGLAGGDPSPLRSATTWQSAAHGTRTTSLSQRQADDAAQMAARRERMLELARRMDATDGTVDGTVDPAHGSAVATTGPAGEAQGADNTDASFNVRYIGSAESGSMAHSPRKSIVVVAEWILQGLHGVEPTDRPLSTLDFTNGRATVTSAGATVLEFNTADFLASEKYNDNFVTIEVAAGVVGSQVAVVHMFHCNPRYEADSLHFHVSGCFAPADSLPADAAVAPSDRRDDATGDTSAPEDGGDVPDGVTKGGGRTRDRFGSFSVPSPHTYVHPSAAASDALVAVGEEEEPAAESSTSSVGGHTPSAESSDTPADDVVAAAETTSNLRLVQRRLSVKRGQLGRVFDVAHLVTLDLTEHSGSTHEHVKSLVQEYFEGATETGVRLRALELEGVGAGGLRISSDCVVTVVGSDVRHKHFPSNIQWSHVYDDSAEAITWLIQRSKSNTQPHRDSHRQWSMRQNSNSTRDEVVFVYSHEEPFDGTVLVEVYSCTTEHIARLRQGFDLIISEHPGGVADPFAATSTRENAPQAFFAHQIRRGTLQATKMIGQGNFGKVYLAKRTLTPEEERLGVSDRCAVKILQEDDASGGKRAQELHAEKKKEFLKESEVMLKLSHPNVLELYGVALQQRPWLAILEYKEYGDMHRVLRMCHARSVHLRPVESMYFCVQIASAMAHVASKRYVHLDIAARNVLLGAQNWVKLADFGSAKEMQPGRDYWRLNVKMEISRRWMAAEAAKNKVFSERTDVWSFGVYCWETLTNCEHPHKGVRLEDVVAHVQCGKFLEMPADCDAEFAALIRSCWLLDDPFSRPTFAVLHKTLRALLARQPSQDMRDIGVLVSTHEVHQALMNESV